MNKKVRQATYWIFSILLSLVMLGSAGMYFIKYDEVTQEFTSLGFPFELVYPLAVLKILGVIAIISNRSLLLKNLAYAGFFFNLMLAIFAHLNANDGKFLPASLAFVFLILSFYSQKKEV